MFLLFGRILLTFIYTENPNSELFCTSSHMDLTPWNGHQPGNAVAILPTLTFIFPIIDLGCSIPFPFCCSHWCPGQTFHSRTSGSEEGKARESWRPFFSHSPLVCLSWQRPPYIVFFTYPFRGPFLSRHPGLSLFPLPLPPRALSPSTPSRCLKHLACKRILLPEILPGPMLVSRVPGWQQRSRMSTQIKS